MLRQCLYRCNLIFQGHRRCVRVCVFLCYLCAEVKIALHALDGSHISEWTSLHVLHLSFSFSNHCLLIICLLDQYLLCMAFSILSQHLKSSEMIPPGTHPPGKGLFVQTAGDIGRVNCIRNHPLPLQLRQYVCLEADFLISAATVKYGYKNMSNDFMTLFNSNVKLY